MDWLLKFKMTAKKKKIMVVGGARPNFMKIAPVWAELKKFPKIFQPILAHTGQHYDYKMSQVFFDDLGLPKPDIYLGVGSGSHAEQTAKIMAAFEKICLKEKPDLVLVVGDVNSTLACSLVAAKLGVPLAHVEAGLRSFDRTMPEEINRLVTDALADFLFVTCRDGRKNLLREGVDRKKIFFVGNPMIDSLKKFIQKARKLKTARNLGLKKNDYVLITLHRPSNVDEAGHFRKLLKSLKKVSEKIPVIFPAHPRTRPQLEKAAGAAGLNEKRFKIIEPIGYLDFLNLMANSRLVLTDSGGIQEETTVLGVPCLTLRKNTERPVTVSQGTNVLVGEDYDKMLKIIDRILKGDFKTGKIPEFWDGRSARRLVEVLKKVL